MEVLLVLLFSFFYIGAVNSHSLLGPAPFYKRAIAIALPVMGQLLIQNFVSLIDNFMVAALGDVKMSGVNITGQINFVFMWFINTLCSSGGIFMSQYNGAHDDDGMQQTFRFKLILCGAAGLLYAVLSFIAPPQLLGLMVHGNAQSAEIVAQGRLYMRAVALSWVFMVVSQSIASSLREIGKVTPPLVISVIATLLNTFGNWILIYGNLGAPRLEVTGAALSTVNARFVEMVLFVIYLKKTKPLFYSRMRDMLKVKIRLFGTILSKSGMILVSEMTWSISETVVTALYNSRGGADVVSGMSAGYAVANLFFVCFSGIFTATGVLLGTTLGAGKIEEARKEKNWLLSGGTIFGGLFAAVGCFSVLLIPFVFGNLSAESQSIARGMVFMNAAYMPLWGLINAQYAISRTGGDVNMGAVSDIAANVVYVPGMWALVHFTALGPVAMMAILKLTDFIKITICAVWLKKEKWLVNLTTIEK
jgi:putative MATE family efflux protein